ncbi:MAG: starvation-sensing protein RspA [Dehalococcoidia bacterium]|jgi:mannonate dehydratase|uniref:Mandelate racemase/muconate lactonizing enzyme C-terminal domain-containing protein n=1 Tax=marine metagenome TaxID=408172 RepID=A0A381MY48_9ZZZZ|nr:starvation-sensing protein RspA [Chloroflexota bacterium]MBV46410.1 starvation-sensing protein RspA [Dehalococcoidia bacterium]MCS5648731.1 starvation-sensing protein RspA [Dehalococcoidia bacterium]MEC7914325.1 enolase C-terminal domain-like protein [Chloroflexota bacterium]HAT22268.1 starvation-sensing protein RspA [Dehalococcoidia bacterium]|tara:strand:+ start:1506 stop:2789 length:1284 start_codon:yes stop_codon:yes gene_type:complete
MSNLRIKDVRTIFTEPDNIRLVIVKIETNEPELYGVGCATFTQRPTAVLAAVEDYLKPFLIGKDPADIEDIWQSSYVSSYWRNGPVLNNALSGVDQALWDIKGKLAGMPVYDLLGGKARSSAAVYVHANGSEYQEVEDDARMFMEQGFHHIRVQVTTPGYVTYGNKNSSGKVASKEHGPRLGTDRVFKPIPGKLHAHPGGIFEPGPYMKSALGLFDHIRTNIGWDIEILHDVHERIPPIQGVGFAKEVEQYKLFFLEDLFSPEDNDYFRMVRQQTSTPIAMGELYNNPHEVIPMVKDRLLDFLRIHISQIGGITPARKLAALCEAFNVRTAWHGPGDTSPVGHAANLMLDLNSINFGIQEYAIFGDNTKEVFPGCPEVKDGYMWPNEFPGLGIDINEELAAKFPFKDRAYGGAWDTVRRADGSVVKP